MKGAKRQNRASWLSLEAAEVRKDISVARLPKRKGGIVKRRRKAAKWYGLAARLG
jgi:hypothetical protein